MQETAKTPRRGPGVFGWTLILMLVLIAFGVIGVIIALVGFVAVRRVFGHRREPTVTGYSASSISRDAGMGFPAAARLWGVTLDSIALTLAQYLGWGLMFLLDAVGATSVVPVQELDARLTWLPCFILLPIGLMWAAGRYRIIVSEERAFRGLAVVLMLAAISDLVVTRAGLAPWSGALALSSWALALPLLLVSFSLTRSILDKAALLGHRAIIVGNVGDFARICEVLRIDPTDDGSDVVPVPTDETGWATLATSVLALARRRLPAASRVFLMPTSRDLVSAVTVCDRLRGLGLQAKVCLDLQPAPGHTGVGRADVYDGVLLTDGSGARSRRVSGALKRLVDIFGSLSGLVLLSPLLLIAGVLIRFDGGSAFYTHTRVGRDGRLFECLKFRTMHPDAKEILAALLDRDAAAREEWERDFKLRDDPRVTRHGAWLREWSLDELPQLVNVFRGEMSLVGPRPIVVQELGLYYGTYASVYTSVKPGLTGLWQVSGRNDTGYEERVQLDARYARNWSLILDLWILLRTVRIVLTREGAY